MTKALVAIVVAAWVVGGVWITGLLTPNVYVHGAAVAAWTALTTGLVWMVTRTHRDFRRLAMGSTAATLVAVIGVGAWLSRPTTVNEQIVTAESPVASTGDTKAEPESSGNTLVASGSFESLAHTTSGRASVIQVGGGAAKLTLSGFKTDPGPDLFVYAVAGDPEGDSDVDDYINLGALKGTEGNQQYDLPKNFDVAKYGHVYIWCRAFTVGFGRAELETG